MNKKIVIDKCTTCPRVHYIKPIFLDDSIRGWCGLLGKVIPSQILREHKLWIECKLEDNNE